MRNPKFILAFLFLSGVFKAQDSTKTITHEIGFNTISLIKQVISNSPENTLDQLPYLVFYNMYFKDKIGLRVGLGLSNSKTETSIEGQILPRTTNSKSLDLRTGISYNFVKHKRITLNAFADYLVAQKSTETINTFTTQTFPNPVEKITTTSKDANSGMGAQIGVGLKYNLYKHLSVYTEVPISYMATTVSSEVTISELGMQNETTKSTTKFSSTNIKIPTTIYLVLRF